MISEKKKILILKCCCSFYTYNTSGNLNRKIQMSSKWLDLGIENNKHKLKRIDRVMKNPYVYLDKEKIVKNFKIEGVYDNEKS